MKQRFSSITSIFCALLLVAVGASGSVYAQSTSVFATGLRAPTKIILTESGNLLVAEAGAGSNTGRVSLVSRSGVVRTVLDGLPAAIAEPQPGAQDPSGPAGLALQGNTLFILIGAGNTTVPGPRPATEAPNPNGPASPILSSVLVARFSVAVDDLRQGFQVTPAQHFQLADGLELALDNGQGATATLAVLADFRDYLPDPARIVRHSNPFGLTLLGNRLYVADASQNTVLQVHARTGRTQLLARFAQLTNPTPVGPPRIDTVPNSVQRFGNQLLVTFLSGFPFPPATAQVRLVNRRTGQSEPLITGLRSAIDVLAVECEGGPRFFVLEFSADQLAQAPGRLTRRTAAQAAPEVLSNMLTSPTSMAYDAETGEIFVTEIFTGRIMRVAF